jgi:hypothetical protein
MSIRAPSSPLPEGNDAIKFDLRKIVYIGQALD